MMTRMNVHRTPTPTPTLMAPTVASRIMPTAPGQDRRENRLVVSTTATPKALQDISIEIPARIRSRRSSGRRAAASRRSSARINRMNDIIPGARVEGTVTDRRARTSTAPTSTSWSCAAASAWSSRSRTRSRSRSSTTSPTACASAACATSGSSPTIVEKSLSARRALGRGEGPAARIGAGALRRPAAAALHRPRAGRRARRSC